MSFPVEIYLSIASHLSHPDLATLARCSRLHSQVAEPMLYRKLSVRLWSGNPDYATSLLLRTLSAAPRLRYFIRDVEVINASSTYWTQGHAKLLSMLLSSILTCPDRIKTFIWKTGQLQHQSFFPNLTTLECGKIVDVEDLLWARWHLLYCRSLRSVKLNVSSGVSCFADKYLLSHLPLQHLQHLSLRRADLSGMSTDVVGSLETLELILCHGLDKFLARLAMHEAPRSLQVLKLAANIPLSRLESFLLAMASKIKLAELSLRIGAASSVLSTKITRAIASTASTLVLDFRQQLSDPRTSLKYTAQDFQDIVQNLPRLKSLGIALDLRKPSCRRYQRTKLKNEGALCGSGLEYLHLRGHAVPLNRFVGDAKHLSAPFGERGLVVLLDHGSRLRKLTCRNKSQEFTIATDKERLRLSTDLYGYCG